MQAFDSRDAVVPRVVKSACLAGCTLILSASTAATLPGMLAILTRRMLGIVGERERPRSVDRYSKP